MKNTTIIKIGALVISRGKLLLIREKSTFDNQYYWNIVKGTFESGKDKNLWRAVEREVKEETSATITKTPQLFNVFEVEKNEKSIIQINFIAKVKNENFRLTNRHEQKKRDEDIIEIKLFNKETLSRMKRKDFINDRAYLTIQDWVRNRKELFRLLF